MSFANPATERGRRTRQVGISRLRSAIAPELSEAVDRILATLADSTAEEQSAGLGWYAVAHEHALEIGQGNVSLGAGIVAAVSPQLGWLENLQLAAEIAADAPQTVPGLSLGIDRARQIRDGADPLQVLGGRKVRSFYANISAPLRSGPVTVDRHAVSIAFGRKVPDTDRTLERLGAYSLTAGAYRAAARTVDLRPHELQAITWLAYRRQLDEIGARGVRRNAPITDDF